MPQEAPISLHNLKKEAVEIIKYLAQFGKNPVEGVKNLPDWNWPTLIITHISIAAFFGIIGGVILGKFGKILSGFTAVPISVIFMTSVLCSGTYYVLMYVFDKRVGFLRLYKIFMLASFPWMILSPLMDVIAPLKPLGFFASGLLLYVGLSEHTQLAKKQISQLVFGVVIAYALFWGIVTIQSDDERRTNIKKATPESLDILEKEMNATK